MTRLFFCLLLLLVASCSNTQTPWEKKYKPTLYAPPPEYGIWWRAVEKCSERHSSLSTVEWFVTALDHLTLPSDSTRLIYAYVNVTTRRVFVAAPYVAHSGVIRHEMLHILIRNVNHPIPPFNKCRTDGNTLLHA